MAPWIISADVAPRKIKTPEIPISPAHCITSSVVMKAEFQWTIENFGTKCRSKEVGEFLKSAHFKTPGDEEVEWFLKVFPNGETEEGFVSIFVYSHPTPLKLAGCSKVKVRQFLIDESNQMEVYKTIDSSYNFLDHGVGWGYEKIPQDNFLSVQNLRCICSLEYEIEKMANLEDPFSSTTEPEADLTTNLAKFLSSTTIGDVTFIVGRKEFQAHKAILSARSPVFAAMFQHDMKEAALNRVDIVGIDPGVFQALLRFIYTDQVDLTVENATGLLAAANRYFLDLLKWRCEKFLAQNLSMMNCCERLILADSNDAQILKKVAVQNIRKFSAKLKKTPDWKKMMKEASPELLREIIESVLP